MVCINNVSILHRFQDITTFTVYVTDCQWPWEVLQFRKIIEIAASKSDDTILSIVGAKWATSRWSVLGWIVRTPVLFMCYMCYIFRGIGVIKISNSKCDLKVTQCYWYWCHLLGHIRFLISHLLQLCLYLAHFTRCYQLFSKILSSHVTLNPSPRG